MNEKPKDVYEDWADKSEANWAMWKERRMNKWVSVKERLPGDEHPVLATTKAGAAFMAWRGGSGTWYRGTAAINHPDFWMPIPPLPEDAVREALRLVKYALDCATIDGRLATASYIKDARVAIAAAEAELDAK